MGWLRRIRDWDPFIDPNHDAKWLARQPPEVQQQLADEPWWSDPEAIQQMHAEGRSNWSYSDWDRFNLARAAAKEDRRIGQQKAALEADELRRSNALEAERRRNMGRGTPKAPSAAVRRLDSDEPVKNMSLQNLREELRDSRAVGDGGSLPSLERSKTSQSREPKPVPTENPDLPEDLDLKGLAELFKDGLLTEEEWMAAKKRILNP